MKKKLVAVTLSLCMACQAVPAYAGETEAGYEVEADAIFLNASGEYSFRERAIDLVSRMTLEEKASQMDNTMAAIPRLGIPAYNTWNEACHGMTYSAYADNHVIGTTSFPQPIAMASTWNRELVRNESEVISDEGRAAYNTVDPETITGMDGGGLTFWTPVVNLERDPRWGRACESWSEDVFLTSEMAEQMVEGLTQKEEYNGVTYQKAYSTAKHFLANNAEDVRMTGTSTLKENELYEYYIAPYRQLLLNGNLESIMTSYNRVNNIPPSASVTLLDKLSRKRWGLDGYIVGDCGAVGLVGTTYAYVGDGEYKDMDPSGVVGAALVLKAGVDNDCIGTSDYYLQAVEEGLISEAELDEALINMFTVRFELGLFDENPWSEYGTEYIDTDENAQAAQEAANEAIVLLENNGILPLNSEDYSDKTIALIGPMADQVVLGQYSGGPTKTSTPTEGVLAVLDEDGVNANVVSNEGATMFIPEKQLYMSGLKITMADGNTTVDLSMSDIDLEKSENISEMVSWGKTYYVLHDGSKIVLKNAELNGAAGLSFVGSAFAEGGFNVNIKIDGNEVGSGTVTSADSMVKFNGTNGNEAVIEISGFEYSVSEEAVQMAKDADVVVLCVGADTNSGREGADRQDLLFPGLQDELIEKVCEVNDNVILAVQSMNMIEIEKYRDQVSAIMWYGFNGQAQGRAMANVLFGKVNPSGHLPFTWYKTEGNLPDINDYYLTSESADGNSTGRTYMYYNGEISYPFGYGLSYTDFEYSNMSLDKDTFTPNDEVVVSVDITNTGSVKGKTVPQVYVYAPDSGNADRPVKKLFGFEKVEIEPGETKTVEILVDASDLWYYEDETGDGLCKENTENYVKNTTSDMDIDGYINYLNGKYVFEVADAASNLTNDGDAANCLKAEAVMEGSLELALQAVTLEPGTIEDGKQFLVNTDDTIQSNLTIALNNDTILDNEEATVTYESNRENVATVDENGLVTAVAPGITTITAKVSYGTTEMSASYVIDVVQ